MKVYIPVITADGQYGYAKVFAPCSTRELARARIDKELVEHGLTTRFIRGFERIVDNGKPLTSYVMIVETEMNNMEQTLYL